jgi:hypothetical protein
MKKKKCFKIKMFYWFHLLRLCFHFCVSANEAPIWIGWSSPSLINAASA